MKEIFTLILYQIYIEKLNNYVFKFNYISNGLS